MLKIGKIGFYFDVYGNGEKSKVKHISPYWGLYCGCVPNDRLDKFISHLENEQEFKTPHRIPSLSLDDPRVASYLHGDTVSADLPNGWASVTVEGYPLGGIKVSDGVAKNHYPKGLRRMG